jgi:hypothetical protein
MIPRGEILQMHGEQPIEHFSHGENSKRDVPFSIDVKGGEIVTLMWRGLMITEEE